MKRIEKEGKMTATEGKMERKMKKMKENKKKGEKLRRLRTMTSQRGLQHAEAL